MHATVTVVLSQRLLEWSIATSLLRGGKTVSYTLFTLIVISTQLGYSNLDTILVLGYMAI